MAGTTINSMNAPTVTISHPLKRKTVARALLSLSLIVLAAVFFYAGFIKLFDVAAFEKSVAHYRLLPAWGSYAVARYLPVLEIALAIGLLIRPWRRASTIIILGLMLAFIAATLSSHLRGIDLQCGCFGSSDSESTSFIWSLARNGVLLILASVAFALVPPTSRRTHKTTNPKTTKSPA